MRFAIALAASSLVLAGVAVTAIADEGSLAVTSQSGREVDLNVIVKQTVCADCTWFPYLKTSQTPGDCTQADDDGWTGPLQRGVTTFDEFVTVTLANGHNRLCLWVDVDGGDALVNSLVLTYNPNPPLKKCGDLTKEGGGVYRVRARVTTCSLARRVAGAVWRSMTGRNRDGSYSGRAPGACSDGRCRIRGYSCSTTRTGYELWQVDCRRRGGRLVRFNYGY